MSAVEKQESAPASLEGKQDYSIKYETIKYNHFMAAVAAQMKKSPILPTLLSAVCVFPSISTPSHLYMFKP